MEWIGGLEIIAAYLVPAILADYSQMRALFQKHADTEIANSNIETKFKRTARLPLSKLIGILLFQEDKTLRCTLPTAVHGRFNVRHVVAYLFTFYIMQTPIVYLYEAYD